MKKKGAVPGSVDRMVSTARGQAAPGLRSRDRKKAQNSWAIPRIFLALRPRPWAAWLMLATKPFGQQNLVFYLLSFGVVLFPLSLLIARPRVGFTSDWYNSLWITGYLSHYFSTHGSIPYFLNSNEFVGITFPIFYGHLFYQALALFGAALGPNLAIRQSCFIIYLIQFGCVYQASLKLTQQKVLSFTVSTLMLWSIYPLSNLYARSALPEFVSFSLLVSVISLWFLILKSENWGEKLRRSACFAVLFSFMCGVHPITAFYGGLSLAIAMLASVYVRRPSRSEWKFLFGVLGATGILVLLTASPWLYAYQNFARYLGIAQQLSRNTYYDGIDQFWIRILPFPFDRRALTGGESTPTTYLDTQINIPLLILTLGCLWERMRGKNWKWKFPTPAGAMALLCLVLSYYVLKASVSPGFEERFVFLLKNFQIAYRMVNYCNLFMLLGLFFIFQLPSARKEKTLRQEKLSVIFPAVALSISACAVWAKQLHGAVIWSEATRFGYSLLTSGERTEFVTVPRSFYSISNYAVSYDLRGIDSKDIAPGNGIVFPVSSTKERFGETGVVTMDAVAGQWVRTNIYPFPWNGILENGVPVPRERLGVAPSPPQMLLKVGKTGPAQYAFTVDPAPSWLLLRRISSAVFWVSLAGIFILWIPSLSARFGEVFY